ncbi:hypothetical protein [Mycobacterium sp. SP-6446]|uniref:hypothetical protein n=1 Tax=Mycobacterium sp. SP-6446 TaxID=1834162 RepID=UPI00096F2C1B|nr:hypothetical protein [Mycobacterium sp. SP-6446]OMC19068.1 hypothetical protein A5736_13910 [Mycobacterium sp. SP-6446]
MPSPRRQPRLTPGAIAAELFCLYPDRDERAPQLCAETLLTLAANGYQSPVNGKPLVTPKQQRFAIRSLATSENFLGGRDEGRAGDDDTTPAEYGACLAGGDEIRSSAHLRLAQQTLQGLIDPDTQRGNQPGAWLLRPFHEALLWYDARKAGSHSPVYGVRKVHMRGSGITLARLITSPADPDAAQLGRSALSEIRQVLTADTPLAAVSRHLESALPPDAPYVRPPELEADEQEAWDRGADPRLAGLATRLCRHAEGIMRQEGASGPAKLWQLRCILALDFAVHLARTAWETTEAPAGERYLLLSFSAAPRAEDPVRQRSEDSYRLARIRIADAVVHTLARTMKKLADGEQPVDWSSEFLFRRGAQSDDDEASITKQLKKLPPGAGDDDYERIARAAISTADYGRGSDDGFRVLLESAGALVGTGSYRYLTAGPDLLAALVGSFSADMPMPSRDFFAAVRSEWDLVLNQESAAETALADLLDGAALERNARRAEKLMSDAGLALGLSDRTTVVGERTARRSR